MRVVITLGFLVRVATNLVRAPKKLYEPCINAQSNFKSEFYIFLGLIYIASFIFSSINNGIFPIYCFCYFSLHSIQLNSIIFYKQMKQRIGTQDRDLKRKLYYCIDLNAVLKQHQNYSTYKTCSVYINTKQIFTAICKYVQ